MPERLDARRKGPGLKPPMSGVFRRELIGPPDCPIMYRWTLLTGRWGKLLVHRFLPYSDDQSIHDHPASFVTVVLSGGYLDRSPEGDEVLRRGAIRFRRAEHRHATRCEASGAWTLVLMGPKRRPWGFWVDSKWWPWREHERAFGFAMRCPDGGLPVEGSE